MSRGKPAVTKEELKDAEDIFQLFARINMIQNHVTARFVRVLPHALTLAQFSILYHLSKHPSAEKTPLELASHFLLSKPSLGEALDKLRKKKFVQLKKNPNDGRSKLVSVTAQGTEAQREAVTAIQPFLIEMRDAVGMENLRAATDMLYPLREWLRDYR
jgi:DNA-binding MarR family transcriptional regulator